jgi:hypothetical protein
MISVMEERDSSSRRSETAVTPSTYLVSLYGQRGRIRVAQDNLSAVAQTFREAVATDEAVEAALDLISSKLAAEAAALTTDIVEQEIREKGGN